MRPSCLRLLLCWLICMPAVSWAHSASESFLHLDIRSQPVSMRWDIDLRDLDRVLGIDRDLDGRLTWGEVESHHAEIADYALAHLSIHAGTSRCRLSPGEQSLVDLTGGTYNVLPIDIDCAGRLPDRVEYDLLFDIDSTHRGLLRLISDEGQRSLVLSRQQARARFEQPGSLSALDALLDYGREGVRHIWLGLDHVLFLLTLLYPAVLRHRFGAWQAEQSARVIGAKVIGIVTAFTIAHSITLALAAFRLVELPAVWVESAIAVTIGLAAINNLRPFLPGPAWAIAFVLGLVHGLGFASVLLELGLPGGAVALALLGFNLGVEMGQLMIVLLLVPVAYVLRTSVWYRVAGLRMGSTVVACTALIWLAERSFGLALFPS